MQAPPTFNWPLTSIKRNALIRSRCELRMALIFYWPIFNNNTLEKAISVRCRQKCRPTWYCTKNKSTQTKCALKLWLTRDYKLSIVRVPIIIILPKDSCCFQLFVISGYVNWKNHWLIHQNQMVFDGGPLICMPPAANVFITLTSDRMTLKTFSASPLTRRIFPPRFIEIPPPGTKTSCHV